MWKQEVAKSCVLSDGPPCPQVVHGTHKGTHILQACKKGAVETGLCVCVSDPHSLVLKLMSVQGGLQQNAHKTCRRITDTNLVSGVWQDNSVLTTCSPLLLYFGRVTIQYSTWSLILTRLLFPLKSPSLLLLLGAQQEGQHPFSTPPPPIPILFQIRG